MGNSANSNESLADLLRAACVVPVMTVDSVESALLSAKALVAGGLRVLEITLRTPAALPAVQRIAAEVADAIVGVGTVVDPAQFAVARASGARFAVSPGCTPELLASAREAAMPYLPGAATVSEVMSLRRQGVTLQKFFPAEVAGGVASLAAIGTVLPDVQFCPTGGITEQRLGDYLRLPNVVAVGGSWMLPKAALQSGDWSGITRLAAAAVAQARAARISAK